VRELPRIAAVVAVTVLVGVVSFLLLPQPEGLNVRSKLAAAFGSGQGATGSSTADGQPAPRDAAAYQGGSLDLRSRGALPGDPMLLVPDASPPLWRGDVLVDYDGTSWSSGSPALTPEPAVPELSVPPGPDDVTGAGATTRTDTVQRLAGFTGLVVAPGRIVSLQVDARTLQTGHSVRIWTDAVDAGTGSYTVTSERPAATPAQLRQAGGPDQVEMANLELPGALPGRVVDLARQVTGTATTRYDKVRAVEAYLAANERYQLDSPVPAAGEDAVDDFLFVSHRGFCEQFASAETVLLRSVGVPARLVTGLAYGQAAPDGQRLFRASDSHAWVEVWYPGTGWVSSDPTAGASLAQDETGTSPMALLKRALSSWGGRLLLAVGLVLLATLLALGARALGRRRRPARATVGSSGAATGPLLAAFARLERALADAGRPRRPSDSLRDLAWRLPRNEATQRALASLERAVYGSRPLAADEALAAEQELDRLAEEVLAGAEGVNVPGGTLR
jgi:transglutaminase-like putative cysteine protease